MGEGWGEGEGVPFPAHSHVIPAQAGTQNPGPKGRGASQPICEISGSDDTVPFAKRRGPKRPIQAKRPQGMPRGAVPGAASPLP